MRFLYNGSEIYNVHVFFGASKKICIQTENGGGVLDSVLIPPVVDNFIKNAYVVKEHEVNNGIWVREYEMYPKSYASEIESITMHDNPYDDDDDYVRVKMKNGKKYTFDWLPVFVQEFLNGKKPFVVSHLGCETFTTYM